MRGRRPGAVFILTLFLVLWCITRASFAEEEALAVVIKIVGKLYCKRVGEEKWRFLKVGDTLSPGDAIRTPPRSQSVIKFNDGTVLRLNERTDLVMQTQKISVKMRFFNVIRMLIGELQFKTLRGTAGFEVETPSAVASVRGTEANIWCVDIMTRVSVMEGLVSVWNDFGKVFVKKGEQCVVNLNEAPQQPVPMKQGDRKRIYEWLERIERHGRLELKGRRSLCKAGEPLRFTISAFDYEGRLERDKEVLVSIGSSSGTMRFSSDQGKTWDDTSISIRRGVANFLAKDETPGRHTITISGEGYAPVSIEATWEPLFKELRIPVIDKDGKERDLIIRYKRK
jgi:hypothetical protein